MILSRFFGIVSLFGRFIGGLFSLLFGSVRAAARWLQPTDHAAAADHQVAALHREVERLAADAPELSRDLVATAREFMTTGEPTLAFSALPLRQRLMLQVMHAKGLDVEYVADADLAGYVTETHKRPPIASSEFRRVVEAYERAMRPRRREVEEPEAVLALAM